MAFVANAHIHIFHFPFSKWCVFFSFASFFRFCFFFWLSAMLFRSEKKLRAESNANNRLNQRNTFDSCRMRKKKKRKRTHTHQKQIGRVCKQRCHQNKKWISKRYRELREQQAQVISFFLHTINNEKLRPLLRYCSYVWLCQSKSTESREWRSFFVRIACEARAHQEKEKEREREKPRMPKEEICEKEVKTYVWVEKSGCKRKKRNLHKMCLCTSICLIWKQFFAIALN